MTSQSLNHEEYRPPTRVVGSDGISAPAAAGCCTDSAATYARVQPAGYEEARRIARALVPKVRERASTRGFFAPPTSPTPRSRRRGPLASATCAIRAGHRRRSSSAYTAATGTTRRVHQPKVQGPASATTTPERSQCRAGSARLGDAPRDQNGIVLPTARPAHPAKAGASALAATAGSLKATLKTKGERADRRRARAGQGRSNRHVVDHEGRHRVGVLAGADNSGKAQRASTRRCFPPRHDVFGFRRRKARQQQGPKDVTPLLCSKKYPVATKVDATSAPCRSIPDFGAVAGRELAIRDQVATGNRGAVDPRSTTRAPSPSSLRCVRAGGTRCAREAPYSEGEHRSATRCASWSTPWCRRGRRELARVGQSRTVAETRRHTIHDGSSCGSEAAAWHDSRLISI